MRLQLISIFAFLLGCEVMIAQDVYPDQIHVSDFVVQIDHLATIPDSSPGVLPQPTVLTQDPKGRIFVNDLKGPVYHIDEVDGIVTKYLDLRDFPELAIVDGFHGLQSFAFHPNFHSMDQPGYGCFYVLFSSLNTESSPDFTSGEETSFHTLLLEWQTNIPEETVFIPADASVPYREILRINQPFGGHVGGLIAFNPTITEDHFDHGNLYIAMGDGAPGGGDSDPLENGENPATPYGAILRINPTGSSSSNGQYGIVSENTFASDGNPDTLPEVYCYGLRNPQRFSWDIVTSEHYIADIGHDVMEEINAAANGANFGWDLLEGSQELDGGNLDGLTYPIAEYDHLNFSADPQPALANRAVTIGDVARGTRIPGLDGNLMAADFPTGIMLILDVDNSPLAGGQDQFRELRVHTGDNTPKRFLEIINEARLARQLAATSRADLRYGVNTPGRIFLINKRDGIIRKIKPVIPLETSISKVSGQEVEVHFKGIIQYSTDLEDWSDLIPQPRSPYLYMPEDVSGFFRDSAR